MKLYTYWRSQASFRVRIALRLKGLAAETVSLDLLKGDQFDPAYRELNPEMVVPTLLDGDGPPVMQSLAILEYLEEKYPQSPLLPEDFRARAHVRGLAQMLAMDAHPFIVPRVRKYFERELHLDEPTRMKWLRHWLDLGSRTIEDVLARDPRTGRFCWGDRPTIADICLVAHLTSAKMLCDSDPAPYPTGDVSSMPACRSRHSRWNTRCGRRVRKRRHPSERVGRVRLTGLRPRGRMCPERNGWPCPVWRRLRHDRGVAHGRQTAESGRRVFQAVTHIIEAGVGTSQPIDASELTKPVASLRERGSNVPATASLGTSRESRHGCERHQVARGVVEHLCRQGSRLVRTKSLRFGGIEAAGRLNQ